MFPLVNLHGGEHSEDADDDVQHDPEQHLGELGLREELQTKLDDEDELTEAHHDEDPALGTNSLTLEQTYNY